MYSLLRLRTATLGFLSRIVLGVGFAYVIWASVVFILHLNTSAPEQLVKLILNTGFFLASVVFWEINKHNLEPALRALRRLLELIIWLSAAQVAGNVVLLDAWLWPFNGQVSSSTAAYAIASPGVVFGGAEKNIWAAKIALAICLYLGVGWASRRYGWGFFLSLLAGLFCILYTFGRTAQLTAFIGVTLFAFSLISSFRRKLIRRFLLGVGLLSLPIISFALIRLFRFDWSLLYSDLSEGTLDDGFRGRLILWATFFRYLDHFDLFWGNGIQYGRYFFPNTEAYFLGNDNFHNAFLNHLVDLGILGLFLYLLIIFFPFAQRSAPSARLLLLAPLLVCLGFQYVGYDNDVMAYLSATWLILAATSNRVLKYGR